MLQEPMNTYTNDSKPRGLCCALTTCVFVFLCACNGENDQLPGDSKVLATVNGASISEYDVERALDKSLGQFAVESAERGARKQVLESLVQSKAMAALAKEELTEQQSRVLEREVEGYRESLLVKHYLSKKSPPQETTAAQLKKYYDDHPVRFGAHNVRRYELLFSTQPVAGAARVEALKSLVGAAQSDDWKGLAATSTEVSKLGYSTGRLSEKSLHEKLKALLEKSQVGETSNVVFVQGRAYVGRVVGVEVVPPKPFAEVREEIQRGLTQVRVRDAVRAVGVEALKSVKVERFAASPEGEDR